MTTSNRKVVRADARPEFRLHILDRDQAEKLWLDEPYIVLSITDPDTPLANLPGSIQQRCLGVHRVSFHDADRYIDKRVILMTKEQAIEMAAFLERYIQKVQHVVVHCEAGISRSAGAAAAIALHYLGDDFSLWQREDLMPNVRVYRYLLYALKGRFR